MVLGDYGEVIVLDWGLAKVMAGAAAAIAVNAFDERGSTSHNAGSGAWHAGEVCAEQAEGRLDLMGIAPMSTAWCDTLRDPDRPASVHRAHSTEVLRQVVHEPATARTIVAADVAGTGGHLPQGVGQGIEEALRRAVSWRAICTLVGR